MIPRKRQAGLETWELNMNEGLDSVWRWYDMSALYSVEYGSN